MFQDGSEAPPTYSQPRCKPCKLMTLAIRACLATRRQPKPGTRGFADRKRQQTSPTPSVQPLSGSLREPAGEMLPATKPHITTPQSLRIPDARSRPNVSLNLRGATSRTPPFTTTQFHVLLNSLFKVLFNFPSRYLFAIGLGVIFSLRWSLPPTLSCTPKQLDSREKVRQNATTALRAYHPLWAVAPVKVDLDWSTRSARRLSQTPHSTRPRWPAVRCWALPVSFAITKGITVVFFSSAY